MRFALLLVTLLAALTGCAHRRSEPGLALVPRPAPPFPPDSVRVPERIQRYHVGRHVDRSQVLHEAHPVYRVEAEATWDLRPHAGFSSSPTRTVPNPDPVPAADLLRAELARQEALSRQVIEQATHLTRAQDQLQSLLATLTTVARDHARLRDQLQTLQERLDRLDPATGVLPSSGLGAVDVPAFSPPALPLREAPDPRTPTPTGASPVPSPMIP